MKRVLKVMLLGVCLGLVADAPVGIASPWIGISEPGVFGTTEDFSVGGFCGLDHGEAGFLTWSEQMFVAKARQPLGNGLSLARFPNSLPLAEASSHDATPFYWSWSALPGHSSGKMSGDEFYDWAVNDVLKSSTDTVTYAYGVAVPLEGLPSKGANGLEEKTEGIVETLTLSDQPECRWTVFALNTQTLDLESLKTQGYPAFNRARRMVQVWTPKECGSLESAPPENRLVHGELVRPSTYGEWMKSIEDWKRDDVKRADGVVLIQDNFDPTSMNLKAAKELALTLLVRWTM